MKRIPSLRGKNKGAALIVALILLMVMSLLGLSSIRATSSQEKMSANAYDRSLAFQAVENALRVGEAEAEKWGEGETGYPTIGAALASDGECNQTKCGDDSGDHSELCQIPDPDCSTPRWESDTPPWRKTDAMIGLSITPQYFVEALSTASPCDPSDPNGGLQECKRFRITARSTADGRAAVVLQSIYATE